MGKKTSRTTSSKNTFRFDPKDKQPKTVASSSKTAPDPSSLSDEDIVADTFGPKPTTPPNVLDKDEYVPIEDDEKMDTDTRDFITITRPTAFACASTISKQAKEFTTHLIVKTINNHFAHNDAFKGVNVRRVNFVRSAVIYFADQESMISASSVKFPDLGIDQLIDYKIYKDNMQFHQRTLHITDIHLNVKQDSLTSVFTKYGKVTNVKMQTRGMWQHAYVTYENSADIQLFYSQWSRYLYNDCVRVYPADLTPEQVKHRNDIRIKLTNLPFGTSACDLQDIIIVTKAKSCYIPRSNNYKPRPFAILYFKSEDTLNDAIKINYAFQDQELQWCVADLKCCHKCGSPEHIVMKCPQIIPSVKEDSPENNRSRSQLLSVQKLYNRYKPAD